MPTILATLEPSGPYTWMLPNNKFFPGPDELHFYSATTLEAIEQQYIETRNYVEVLGWEATTEIRSGWYSMTHGISQLRGVATEEFLELESVTMFPVGASERFRSAISASLGRTAGLRSPHSLARSHCQPIDSTLCDCTTISSKLSKRKTSAGS